MRIAVILLSFIIFSSCHSQTSSLLEGRAVKFQDGDTFDLLMDNNITVRIRLHGIDCPERGQDYSKVAKTALTELLLDKKIRADKTDTDRYGRTVAIVYADSVCVNEEMLRNGLAWHYTRYDQNPAWSQLQSAAMKNKIGLWSLANPTPPWEWRAARRN